MLGWVEETTSRPHEFWSSLNNYYLIVKAHDEWQERGFPKPDLKPLDISEG